jgi:SH3-like domain-containing protein
MLLLRRALLLALGLLPVALAAPAGWSQSPAPTVAHPAAHAAHPAVDTRRQSHADRHPAKPEPSAAARLPKPAAHATTPAGAPASRSRPERSVTKTPELPGKTPHNAGPVIVAHRKAPTPAKGAAGSKAPGKPAPAAVAKPPAASAAAPPAAAETPAGLPKGSATGLPLPRFAALRSDEVNMRAGPGTRYPIDWVYKRRDLPVEIEREFEVWRLVSDPDGGRGWVHQATLTGRRSFIVLGAPRDLREKPEDGAAAVARLKPAVVGRILHCDAGADWCRVQVGDYRGWLKREEFWGTLKGEAIN